MSQNDINLTPEILPLIPLRGLVVFPGMHLHFDAGRDKSIAAVNAAMESNKEILLVAQKDIADEDPKSSDLFEYGCTAKVRQLLKLNDGTVRVMVEGKKRVKIINYVKSNPFFVATFIPMNDSQPRVSTLYKEAAIRHIKNLFEDFVEVAPKLPVNVVMTVRSIDKDLAFLTDFIAANLPFQTNDKQTLLEIINPLKRVEALSGILEREAELLAIDAEISEKVKFQMDENQKDYYLREQLKAISEELYGEDNPREEANEYIEKIKSLNASSDIKDKLLKEVNKLEKMPSGSQEATVIRNYIDVCISLPWGCYTDDKISIKKATAILEKEHYGLEKVKERILETLSVHALTGEVSGSIICLVGPPGVGKTSIARSVANCMNRRFSRISLGGIHDEAEIRGHRRTYIGSMPGRIIDAVKNAASSNPVLLLDEIDKLGSDYKGDPSSALLEALDPEQNNTFKDHFLDLPFDLSKVLFITTANSASSIPGPLLDRMEVIDISGYTREDKFNIAKKYLVKKQLSKNGLDAKKCKIANSAIYKIIDSYTREAGVRKLEQCIGTVCRKSAKAIVEGSAEIVSVTNNNISQFLGAEKFKNDALLPRDEVGVVNGLAWTQVGGTLMQLEVSILEGSGKIELTGSLGDVMKESARTAVSFVRSIASQIGIDADFYKTKDIHIHATESAIPKDGPSAGITMVTALVSALSDNPINREVAMTGEISLKGRVLPIGGLKEKTMAAYTCGVKTVFIPAENIPDIDEIDAKVREALEIIPVNNACEVLSRALIKPFACEKKADIKYILSEKHSDSAVSSAKQ